MEVSVEGGGCYRVQVRGGEVEWQELCAEALVQVHVVEPVAVVVQGDQVEVRRSGVEEVRIYTLDGREVMRSNARYVWVGGLACGMYFVRVRCADQWQMAVVLVGR